MRVAAEVCPQVFVISKAELRAYLDEPSYTLSNNLPLASAYVFHQGGQHRTEKRYMFHSMACKMVLEVIHRTYLYAES